MRRSRAGFRTQKNRSQERTGFVNPVNLATCLTWLQADRPNHHGIRLPYAFAGLAPINGVWFGFRCVICRRDGFHTHRLGGSKPAGLYCKSRSREERSGIQSRFPSSRRFRTRLERVPYPCRMARRLTTDPARFFPMCPRFCVCRALICCETTSKWRSLPSTETASGSIRLPRCRVAAQESSARNSAAARLLWLRHSAAALAGVLTGPAKQPCPSMLG